MLVTAFSPFPNVFKRVLSQGHQKSELCSKPNEKNLDLTNLKAFGDEKINVAYGKISVFQNWVEILLEKDTMPPTSIFILFP